MYLDDLPTAVRGSGLTVHEVGNWRSHDHGPMGSVIGVICHHTGSSGSGAEGVVAAGRSDLAGPLAQLTLRRDGSVGVISHGECWHAGTGSWPSIGRNVGNDRCIGIEAVYNGSDITDAQLDAYPRLVAALCRHYRIAVGNVIGHREWAPDRKVDPGKLDMPAFRRAVQTLLNGGTPPVVPAPAPTGGAPLLKRGSTDVEAVKTLQRRLKAAFAAYAGNLVIDGNFGPATEAAVREFQRRSGLVVDGVVGPATRSALRL